MKNLIKITDTSGKVTGTVGKVSYHVVIPAELAYLYKLESDGEFEVENIGPVTIHLKPDLVGLCDGVSP